MRNLSHAGLLVVELHSIPRHALVPLILRRVVEFSQDHAAVSVALQTQLAEARKTVVRAVARFDLGARVRGDKGGDGRGSAAGRFQGGEEPLDEVVGEDLQTGVDAFAVRGGEGGVQPDSSAGEDGSGVEFCWAVVVVRRMGGERAWRTTTRMLSRPRTEGHCSYRWWKRWISGGGEGRGRVEMNARSGISARRASSRMML